MNNRHPVQVAALLTGAVFGLVGVLGIIPRITSRWADLSFAGHQSGAHLLGLFQISIRLRRGDVPQSTPVWD